MMQKQLYIFNRIITFLNIFKSFFSTSRYTAYKIRVGMISTHPCSEGGVSLYTKNLTNTLLRHKADVILFSNKPNGSELIRNCIDKPNDPSICACWDRGLWYPFQIFKRVVSNDVNIIHIQHEFFLYGDSVAATLFPLLLLFLKILRKPVVVTLHGVVPLEEINKQFLRQNKLQGILITLKLGSLFLVKIISLFSKAIIVHNKSFVELLRRDYKCGTKVFIIPHGIKEMKIKLKQDDAKKKLGLEDKKLILFFGYITGYKGIETLIEGFGHVATKHKDWILIIGGGEHPRLRNNSSYKHFIFELQRKASTLAPHQIIFNGFISEEDLPIYFSAVDFVVFPYNTVVASSGALTLAMGYSKPVLLSRIAPFEELINVNEAFFERNSPRSLADRLEFLMSNPCANRKILNHMRKVTRQFSWENIGLKTVQLYKSLLCETE